MSTNWFTEMITYLNSGEKNTLEDTTYKSTQLALAGT